MSTKADYQAQIDLYNGFLTDASDRVRKLEDAKRALQAVSVKIKFELDEGGDDIKFTYNVAGDKYNEHLENEKEVVETARSDYKKLKDDTIADLDDDINYWSSCVTSYEETIRQLRSLKASAEE